MMGPAPSPVDDQGRLSPAFSEWMMGFPPGWTDQMSRTPALGALGNAVVPQQGMLAFAILLGDDEEDDDGPLVQRVSGLPTEGT